MQVHFLKIMNDCPVNALSCQVCVFMLIKGGLMSDISVTLKTYSVLFPT